LVNELPEDTNWEELMYKIYVRQSIEEGLQDSEEGNTTPHEEIKKKSACPMKIIWTVKTERQLVQIFEYIASDSELYAYRLVNQLEFKCHKLKGSKTAILK
jgi:hypothetical protein